MQPTSESAIDSLLDLPGSDNTPAALKRYREANMLLRGVPWPAPFDSTTHSVHLGDARDLSWLANQSVHLVVTSPPYCDEMVILRFKAENAPPFAFSWLDTARTNAE